MDVFDSIFFTFADIFSEFTDMKKIDNLPQLYLYTPGADFVRPYFEKSLTDYLISDTAIGANHAVMISSTEIYDVQQGLNYNELTPVNAESQYALDEQEFKSTCAKHGLHPTILRAAPVICTGMTGFPREIAEKIYKGTYFNIKGNDAQRSIVHAVDLPQAARLTLDSGDIFNVTDDSSTKVIDLADALAWRIAQKRLFTLGPKWYRFLFGKKNYEQSTLSLTFSAEKLKSAVAYKPVSVVEYLKTHTYDESSL